MPVTDCSSHLILTLRTLHTIEVRLPSLPMQVVVHDTPQLAAQSVAQLVADSVNKTDERFSLGLAGGSTPEAMYLVLRQLEVDWSNSDLWLSDERWVPHDDQRSNGRMATDTLVDSIAARFHRPVWSREIEPDDSASRYEETLRSLFREGRPDLILLGMGEDGHTASLFPGSVALAETARWYVSNVIPKSGEPRLTATYPLLWSARKLVVMAVGNAKASAVRDSFRGLTPAGEIGNGDAEVEWHLDTESASQVS